MKGWGLLKTPYGNFHVPVDDKETQEMEDITPEDIAAWGKQDHLLMEDVVKFSQRWDNRPRCKSCDALVVGPARGIIYLKEGRETLCFTCFDVLTPQIKGYAWARGQAC